jgi:hypothetical protein
MFGLPALRASRQRRDLRFLFPLDPPVTLWGVTETVPRTEAGAVFLFLPQYLWDNEPTLAFLN